VVFDDFGTGSQQTFINVIPRSCKVSLNSYNQADTFDMEFDGKAFPLSPDMLRSAAVQIYMYQTDQLHATDQWPEISRPTLAGLIDRATLDGANEGVVFKCSGRDYTALLMDKEWDPTKRVKMGRDLVSTVQELVDEASQAKRTGRTLTVTFEGGFESPPLLGALHYKASKKRGLTPQNAKNYWDVIYQLCLRSGFIVFVRGFEVVISRPQILQDQAKVDLPKLVYGRNLSSLSVDRKLGKERVPQILVKSYDPTTKTNIQAKFPEQKDAVTTGVGTEKEETKVFTVDGISDERTLKRFAENAYNTLARGESTVSFSTVALKDLDEEHDLLQLRAGSAVAVGFDPFVSDATLHGMSTSERYDRLIGLGYNNKIAMLVAREYDKMSYFRRPFYVKEVVLTWDYKEGIMIEVEAMNFISVPRDEKRA